MASEDELSMDEAELDAELERQLAEMSDVELSDDEFASKWEGSISSGASNKGHHQKDTHLSKIEENELDDRKLMTNLAHNTGESSFLTGNLANFASAAVAAIAGRFQNRQSSAKRDILVEQRKALWQKVEDCNHQQKEMLSVFDGEIAEAKSMLQQQKQQEMDEELLKNANKMDEKTSEWTGSPESKSLKSEDTNEDNELSEANFRGDGPPSKKKQMDTFNFTANDVIKYNDATIQELQQTARENMSSAGSKLLDEQDRQLIEERQLFAHEQAALSELVERSQQQQQKARDEAKAAEARIQEAAAKARQRIEENFRQQQRERSRAEALEAKRRKRYEENIRRMREITQRSRKRREAAAKEAKMREERRHEAIRNLKIKLIREANCVKKIQKSWRRHVLKKKVAFFLQNYYRISRAQAKLNLMRRDKKAATIIQGLFRKSQARRLRNDLAAMKRLKLRVEREERKRLEILAKKKRERERRHQLKLLEQEDARSSLCEAIFITAQTRDSRALESALVTFQKIIPLHNIEIKKLDGKEHGIKIHETKQQQDEPIVKGNGVDDTVLLSKSINLQRAMMSERKGLVYLQGTLVETNDVWSYQHGLDILRQAEIDDQAKILSKLEMGLKSLRDLVKMTGKAAVLAEEVAAITCRKANSANSVAIKDNRASSHCHIQPHVENVIIDTEEWIRKLRRVKEISKSVQHRIRGIIEAADLGSFEGGVCGLFSMLQSLCDCQSDIEEKRESNETHIARENQTKSSESTHHLPDDSNPDRADFDFVLRIEALQTKYLLAIKAVQSYLQDKKRQFEARVDTALSNENIEAVTKLMTAQELEIKRISKDPCCKLLLPKMGKVFTHYIRSIEEIMTKSQIEISSIQAAKAEIKLKAEKERERRAAEVLRRQKEAEEAAAAQKEEELERTRQKKREAETHRQQNEHKDKNVKEESMLLDTHMLQKGVGQQRQERMLSTDQLRNIVSKSRQHEDNSLLTPDLSNFSQTYYSDESVQKALVLLQAFIRGTRIRKRFTNARAQVALMWGGDHDEYGEVDVDAFLDLGTSRKGLFGDDSAWMNDVFDELEDNGHVISGELREKDVEENSLAGLTQDQSMFPAAGEVLDTIPCRNEKLEPASRSDRRPSHPGNDKNSNISMDHLYENNADLHSDHSTDALISTHKFDEQNSSQNEERQRGLSEMDRETEILNEWGFSNPNTAKQLLKRRRKFEKGSKRKSTKYKRANRKTTGMHFRGGKRSFNYNKQSHAKQRYADFMAHMGLAHDSSKSVVTSSAATKKAKSLVTRKHNTTGYTDQELRKADSKALGFSLVKDDDKLLKQRYSLAPKKTLKNMWIEDTRAVVQKQPTPHPSRNLPPLALSNRTTNEGQHVKLMFDSIALNRETTHCAQRNNANEIADDGGHPRRLLSASAIESRSPLISFPLKSTDLHRGLMDKEHLLESLHHLPRGGARGLLPRRALTAERL